MAEGNQEQLLLEKIAELEKQYQITHEARLEAERKLNEVHPLHHHTSHHAMANQKAWGASTNIHFMEKQAIQHRRPSKAMNPDQCRNAILNRMCLGYNMAEFIQKPVLHQYMEDGKMLESYREAEERQSSKFELFFDLLFVGVVHQMSDAAAESPNGIGLVKYILTFLPAFSIWGDIRDTMNQMGMDDVSQRLFILWTMALLVGYSINASAIELSILSRHLDAESPSIEINEQLSSRLALQYAMGFFCVAKLSKLTLSLAYSYLLPRSRYPLMAIAFNNACMCLCFFIAIFLTTRSLTATYALIVLGIFLDVFLRTWGWVYVKLFNALKIGNAGMRPKKDLISEPGVEDDGQPDLSRPISAPMTAMEDKKSMRIPVIAIEHHIERLGSFVTIVLGEMIISVFFKSTFATGLNVTYIKAVLGLVIAFNLNWMYFDSGATHNYIHAIRRHWLSAFWFTLLHSPLCASLLLASAATNRFVTSNEAESGLLWFFCVGIGLSIIIMATIGILHKVLEVPHKTIHLRRRVIFATRYAAGIVLILLPLAREGLNALHYMIICAAITAFLIIEELVMRLERAEELIEG